MPFRRFTIFALLLLCSLGCAHLPQSHPATTAPAEAVVVSRLNPQYLDVPPDASRAEVYGFEKLAERTVTDATLVRRLRAAVTDPATYEGEASGRCFVPRLIVRLTDADRWTDYVVCTSCRRVQTLDSAGNADDLRLTEAGCDRLDALMAELFPQYVVGSTAGRP